MKEPRWIGVREAIAIHGMQIDEHGGRRGIRDMSLLESALARPVQHHSYSGTERSIPHLAAMYASGIVRNHPFVDGNKRVGLVVAATFLEKNEFTLDASQVDAYHAFMNLASGDLEDSDLLAWFEKNSLPAKRRPSGSANF